MPTGAKRDGPCSRSPTSGSLQKASHTLVQLSRESASLDGSWLYLAMSDWTKTVLPALIGVFGTGITVFFGYRQWKRQQKTAREESFNNDRKAAYKALWDLTESFNVELRARGAPPEKGVTELNAFLLKSGLYIQPEHCELAKRYAAALSQLDSLIRGSQDAKLRGKWSATANPLPPDAVSRFREIELAHNEANFLRDRLIETSRSVLLGQR
jgi:hypothetical protein